ncbi:hypothetical protein BX616_010927 [Lobosporangium transversale]|nr:hypothetical protein BX616_010927 [Lobosporangium transversale]
MMKDQFQQLRKANSDIIEKVCVRIAPTSRSNGSNSSFYVTLQDIRNVFPDAHRFMLDGSLIPFLVDGSGNRIDPLRIAFYPDKVLDVVAEGPKPCNINNSLNSDSNSGSDTTISLPTLKKSVYLASQELLQSLSVLIQSFSSSLVTHENTQKGMTKSDLEQIEILLLYVKKRDEGMLKLQSEMHSLRLKAKENDKVTKLQLEVLKLRLESKEKDEKIINLQHQALSRPTIIQEHANQAPDRATILQKHAEAILAQNYELYEYPLSRLFIILPVDSTKWDPTNVLRNKVRLYFLCEYGDHSIKTRKDSHDQIHIVKHEEYEIQYSMEFFRKYGKHMVILLEWLKLRMLSPTSLRPIPNLTNAGIDKSLDYMKALSAEYPALININTFDDYEVLEGADLRQLGTFLQTSDKYRQICNLYRTTTEVGHVRWICADHFHLDYREKGQKALLCEIALNGGKYNMHLGKAMVKLESSTRAKVFLNALANARCVYELDITLNWDWSEATLEALERALKVSGISILRLELGLSQESSSGNAVPRSTRYEALIRIIELNSMRVIHIALSPDLIELSRLEPRSASHLHKLSFEMEPQGVEANDFRVLVNSLKTNTTLLVLDLEGNSIGDKGALALSEALKTNTALTSLSLRENSIGHKGALALSKALKINTTLTTLNLNWNLIEEKGAVVLLEALKSNTTLVTLGLRGNSIGREGALTLAEALKVNTGLAFLDLHDNSLEKEGILALSEALKTNKVLTDLNLGGNGVRNEGALALSEALKVNTTLTILGLSQNLIKKEGALAFLEALRINTTLTSLDLWDNLVGEEESLALSEALKVNAALALFD